MPLPASVGHASAALRRFIRWKDEEAVSGSVKFGTPRRVEPVSNTTNRWRMRVDLRHPVPGDGRAKTRSGYSPFHLEVTLLSKSGVANADVSRGSVNGAVAHEIYLSDGVQVTAAHASGFERYLGDERHAGNAGEKSSHQSRVNLILSNIGDTLEARTTFWNKAWEVERTPSTMRLEFCPERDDSFDFEPIIGNPEAPLKLRDACLLYRNDRDEFRRRLAGRKVLTIELTEQQDVDWALAHQKTFRARRRPVSNDYGAVRHDNKSRRAIHLVKPRAGGVQMGLVAELPHELDVEQQHVIANEVYVELQRLGVPITLVVHQPDGRNDERQWHLHVIFYERRCERRPDGSWDPSRGRKLRPGDLAEALHNFSAEGDHRERASADLLVLRTVYAAIVNRTLRDAGHQPRYSPSSYATLGIQRVPQQHLGKDASALAKAGVSVAADRDNARTYWDSRLRELKAVIADCRLDDEVAAKVLMKRLSAIGLEQDPKVMADLDRMVTMRREASDAWEALARHELDRDMAESASLRLKRTTDRLLESIDQGHAKSADIAHGVAIRRRNELAQAHLDEIGEALDPLMPDLFRLQEEERQTCQNIEELTRVLDDLIADKQASLNKKPEKQQLTTNFRTKMSTVPNLSAEAERGSPAKQHEPDLSPAERQWRNGSILGELHRSPLRPHEHFAKLVDIAKGPANTSQRLHLLVTTGGDLNFYGLGPVDVALLQDAKFATRTVPAFLPIAHHQTQAIDRLLSYVRKHGVVGLNTKTGDVPSPPDAIRTIYVNYCGHPFYRRRAPLENRRYVDAQTFSASQLAALEEEYESSGFNDNYVPPAFSVAVPTGSKSRDSHTFVPSSDAAAQGAASKSGDTSEPPQISGGVNQTTSPSQSQTSSGVTVDVENASQRLGSAPGTLLGGAATARLESGGNSEPAIGSDTRIVGADKTSVVPEANAHPDAGQPAASGAPSNEGDTIIVTDKRASDPQPLATLRKEPPLGSRDHQPPTDKMGKRPATKPTPVPETQTPMHPTYEAHHVQPVRPLPLTDVQRAVRARAALLQPHLGRPQGHRRVPEPIADLRQLSGIRLVSDIPHLAVHLPGVERGDLVRGEEGSGAGVRRSRASDYSDGGGRGTSVAAGQAQSDDLNPSTAVAGEQDLADVRVNELMPTSYAPRPVLGAAPGQSLAHGEPTRDNGDGMSRQSGLDSVPVLHSSGSLQQSRPLLVQKQRGVAVPLLPTANDLVDREGLASDSMRRPGGNDRSRAKGSAKRENSDIVGVEVTGGSLADDRLDSSRTPDGTGLPGRKPPDSNHEHVQVAPSTWQPPRSLSDKSHLEHARSMYNQPEHARTRQVADFLALLRSGASEEELKRSAELISKNKVAAEDVTKLRTEVGIAYRLALDDASDFYLQMAAALKVSKPKED